MTSIVLKPWIALPAVLTALAAAIGGVRPGATLAQAPRADLIVVNGPVFTGAGRPVAEAVAVTGDRITAVGTRQAVDALRGPSTVVVDAAGGTVVPGFNDSHVHFLSGSLSLTELDLSGARTLDEVQQRIRDFAAKNPSVPWIRGRGWNYSAFPGGLPTRAQLDAALSDRPATLVCFDGHSSWVNSQGPGGRRDHQGHARSAGRRDHPRPGRAARRPAQGVGAAAGAQGDAADHPRRPAPGAAGRHRPRPSARRDQRAERQRQRRGVRALRGTAAQRRAETAGLLGAVGRARLHRSRRRSLRRHPRQRGRRSVLQGRGRQAAHRRRHRDQHRGDAGALRQQSRRAPACRTTRRRSSTASSACSTPAATRSSSTPSATAASAARSTPSRRRRRPTRRRPAAAVTASSTSRRWTRPTCRASRRSAVIGSFQPPHARLMNNPEPRGQWAGNIGPERTVARVDVEERARTPAAACRSAATGRWRR